jgi:hypothetical protein
LYSFNVRFLHSELNEKNNAHKGIISKLKKYDLLGASQPLMSPSRAPHEGHRNRNKNKNRTNREEEKETEEETNRGNEDLLTEFKNLYPDGKGIHAIAVEKFFALESRELLDMAVKGVQGYIGYMTAKDGGIRYVLSASRYLEDGVFKEDYKKLLSELKKKKSREHLSNYRKREQDTQHEEDDWLLEAFKNKPALGEAK